MKKIATRPSSGHRIAGLRDVSASLRDVSEVRDNFSNGVGAIEVFERVAQETVEKIDKVFSGAQN